MQKQVAAEQTHPQQENSLSDIKAVVFDMDGVLRDTRILLWDAYKRSLESVGIDVHMSADELHRIIGLTRSAHMSTLYRAVVAVERSNMDVGKLLDKDDATATINSAIDKYVTPSDDALLKHAYMKFLEVFDRDDEQRAVRIDGAKETVEWLTQRGYFIGVFSASTRITVLRDSKLFGFDVPDFFVIARNDVPFGKPHPEGLALLMDRFEQRGNGTRIDPQNVIFIGDNVTDIMAAKAIGCIAIGVLTGQGTDKLLEEAGADYIFNDLNEFRATMLLRGRKIKN